jgi:hypothetical protein
MSTQRISITTLWIGLIFVNSLLGRQLYNGVQSLGGWTLFLLFPLTLSFCCIRYAAHFIKGGKVRESLLYLFIGVASCFLLELPEERVHILLFGFLGFLLGVHSQRPALQWILLGLLVAVLDEGLQALLPYRVGDLRDIIINSLSLLLGALAALRCGIRQ